MLTLMTGGGFLSGFSALGTGLFLRGVTGR
jgi:hypothetical protein